MTVGSAVLIAVLPIAHGITGEATDYTTLQFIPLGIEHMALGWDHLLFILGVIVLAAEPRRAAKLITAFVAGHSLTLALATSMEWKLDATLVDVVIALSLVYVGVLAWRGRPREWTPVLGTVFAFGLVHGFGLSTRLQEAGIPDDGLFVKTLAFNVGVEIGQLLVIVIVLGIGSLLLRVVRTPPQPLRYAGGALVLVGLVAAAVLSFAGIQEDGQAGERRGASCTETDIDPPTFAGGGHPKERFGGPDSEVVRRDLVHVLTDGFVVVRYDPKLPAGQVDELRAFVARDDRAVVGAPDPAQGIPVRVVTAYRELRCDSIEMTQVAAFTDRWLDDVRDGRVR